MAKQDKAVEPVEVELWEVFDVGEDGRMYCKTCTYDTAKEGSARRHTMAVHQTKLKPLPILIKKRGAIPESLPTEIVEIENPVVKSPEKNIPAQPMAGEGA